jgi:large subunit ribosomal protein L24
MRIRTNDEVVVLAGRDRGKRGKVLRVLLKKDRVVVEGVNVITRHLKRRPQNPQAGGRVQRPAPIHVSNVALWSGADGRAVRVRMQGEGREKIRVSAKSGEPIRAGGKAAKAEKPAKAEKTAKAEKPEKAKAAKGKAKADKSAGE